MQFSRFTSVVATAAFITSGLAFSASPAQATERWAHTAPESTIVLPVLDHVGVKPESKGGGRWKCDPQPYGRPFRDKMLTNFIRPPMFIFSSPYSLDIIVTVKKCWREHRPRAQKWRIEKVFVVVKLDNDSDYDFQCPEIVPGFRSMKWALVADDVGVDGRKIVLGGNIDCDRGKKVIWKTYRFGRGDRLPWLHINRHGLKPKMWAWFQPDIARHTDDDSYKTKWQLR